jgi:hypothetical protein
MAETRSSIAEGLLIAQHPWGTEAKMPGQETSPNKGSF